MGTQRDELMQKFGPILFEAFMVMCLDEVNRIRTHVGLPVVTKDQFLAEINNHTSSLEPYSWMNESG